MSDVVRVNGNLLARQSCTLKMDGEPFYAWTAIEFGDKRERAYGFGAGRHGGPIGITPGKYTPDPLVITFHKHATDALEKSLAGKVTDNTSIGNAVVTWTLTIDEPDTATVIEVFEGCRLTERSDSVEDTADPMTAKRTFMPMRRKTNDRTLFDSSAAGA